MSRRTLFLAFTYLLMLTGALFLGLIVYSRMWISPKPLQKGQNKFVPKKVQNEFVPKILKKGQNEFVPKISQKGQNESDPDSTGRHQYANVQKCRLTLFTSMPVNSTKPQMYMNTVHNWRLLHQWNITTILFSDASKTAEAALSLGWKILPIPARAPGCNMPILPAMFQEAIIASDSCLYGFVNADIIFDETFLKTMEELLSTAVFGDQRRRTPMLVISKRTNLHGINSTVASDWEMLSTMAHRYGKPFIAMSEDVFIASPDYPWADYPPVAVGLRAYDNWLLLRANELDHITVDVSRSLMAVHQNQQTDNKDRQHTNGNYNIDLLQEHFGVIDYSKGKTTCAAYESIIDNKLQRVVIRRRNPTDLDICHTR